MSGASGSIAEYVRSTHIRTYVRTSGSIPPLLCMTLSFLPSPPDIDGQLTKALLVGNFQAAVEICLKADRMVSYEYD